MPTAPERPESCKYRTLIKTRSAGCPLAPKVLEKVPQLRGPCMIVTPTRLMASESEALRHPVQMGRLAAPQKLADDVDYRYACLLQNATRYRQCESIFADASSDDFANNYSYCTYDDALFARRVLARRLLPRKNVGIFREPLALSLCQRRTALSGSERLPARNRVGLLPV